MANRIFGPPTINLGTTRNQPLCVDLESFFSLSFEIAEGLSEMIALHEFQERERKTLQKRQRAGSSRERKARAVARLIEDILQAETETW